MTREEYFTVLKNNIQSLSIDEQNEALQYYSDYFDDAGDDEKAMKDLGDPEKVAAEIRDKFSNALATNKEASNSEEKKQSENGNAYDALYYEFAPSIVKNVNIAVGAAEIVMVPGTKYCVETRGINPDFFECRVDENGTFKVQNMRKLTQFRFWEHNHNSRMVPRILITIPQGAKTSLCKISLGAGKLTTKDISLSCVKANLEVGAGNLVLGNINSEEAVIRCGMGNLDVKGEMKGSTNIDCGMGSIKLVLNQTHSDCSYDARIGLGNFKFDDFHKGGVSQINCNERKQNHFSVNVGMGNVTILTK